MCTNSFIFPINVFSDVKMESFLKHNKKHVTEDYVAENFKEIGWRVYRPFNDTGIDLIITKNICPNDHTNLNESLMPTKLCPVCNSKSIEIKRFIQVKTREVKGTEQFFGYTLRSKDFRCDPRHVFLLYSDRTNDFIIIPIYDYLKLFSNNEKSYFGTPSFRVGNSKQNGLNKDKNGWHCSGIDFNPFVNTKGLEIISKALIDKNLNDFSNKISKLKFSLFYKYNRGKQGTNVNALDIQNHINNTILNEKYDVKKLREEIKLFLSKTLSNELIRSINEGYFIKFKGVKLDE